MRFSLRRLLEFSFVFLLIERSRLVFVQNLDNLHGVIDNIVENPIVLHAQAKHCVLFATQTFDDRAVNFFWFFAQAAFNRIDNDDCVKTTKAPTSVEAGALNLNPAASYSSIRRPYSTIGAGGLNGRVRDGIGCITSAIATGNFSETVSGSASRVPSS
jgi:hypothetical protein